MKEAVAETQRIMNETQRMVKVGSKWLKALFEAHLEEAHKCEDGKMHCQNDNQCGANGKCIFQ